MGATVGRQRYKETQIFTEIGKRTGGKRCKMAKASRAADIR